MLKRTVFFGNPYHIHLQNAQLTATMKETGTTHTVPIEDLGFLVLEHPQITFTLAVMQQLAAHNVAVVFCDTRFMPASLMLHLDTHYVQAERFRTQLVASAPLKKQLWQQTIKAKILNQAAVLRMTGISDQPLDAIAGQVLSGDSSNREAKAARIYWNLLLGSDFKRGRYEAYPNSFLNYGYAIIRAGIARALAGSGLLPTLGIHHRNKYNSYALADDIMEPYRPFVDLLVWQMTQEADTPQLLGTKQKQRFLSLLAADTVTPIGTSPMMVAMQMSASSLSKCFEGKIRQLMYPIFPCNK